MPRGFVYVVATVGKDYQQPRFCCVPTWHAGQLYFGPCKIPMRPRMKPGDFVFGISPSCTKPRRMLFAARIAERITFADAYHRFEDLRGPEGPIHVRPVHHEGLPFPDSEYEHIPCANHAGKWHADLRKRELDAFFVCDTATGCSGRWLGSSGPAVTGPILKFLQQCEIWGKAGSLSPDNLSATETAPIRYGRLYTGLHLETYVPEQLLTLVCEHLQPHLAQNTPPRIDSKTKHFLKPARSC